MSYKKQNNFRDGRTNLRTAIDDEFRRVYNAINATRTATGAGASIRVVYRGSTGGGSIPDIYRAGSVPVVSGSNVITFSTPLSTTNYDLHCFMYTSDGYMVEITPTPTKSTNGFTISLGEAGTLVYLAIIRA